MTEPTTPRRPRRRRAAALLLAVGAVITASGTWAAWQSTGSLTQSVSSATVTVNVADAGTGQATWTTGITNLLPGDYFHRWVTVTNTGSVPQEFAGTLSGTATLPGALTAWISSCDVAFAAGSTNCTGTSTNHLGTSGTPAAFGSLSNLGTINAGASKHLLVRVVFSASADQTTYQNQNSTLTLAFTGTANNGGGADRTNG
ncbi:hypothetical protein [Sporichthya polymorpha]|uniref:hypothetical protein n=1 Tax=Sporichthya polymorpha TaxID=35751 RepID=UPI000381CE39|nr:hypothetical protein [Sporichthya polymorpha]